MHSPTGVYISPKYDIFAPPPAPHLFHKDISSLSTVKDDSETVGDDSETVEDGSEYVWDDSETVGDDSETVVDDFENCWG